VERKRLEGEFKIQPTISLPTIANNGSLSPFSPGRPDNPQEVWISQEWRKRMAITQAILVETKYAHDTMAYLQLHGFTVFEQTADDMHKIKEEQRAETLQPYIDAYHKRAVEDLATRLLGLNDVAISNIAYNIHRDHYPPDPKEPKEPKGWIQRFFGS